MKYVFSENNKRDIDTINIGAKLRLLRQFNHLSQREVAKPLGITRSAYAYYELNITRPSYETLLQIANLYDVSLSFLLE